MQWQRTSRRVSMPTYHEVFELKSSLKPCFHDITGHVREAVSRSGISDGIAVVYSQHTTCSVMIQEESHDRTFDGTKYLLQDLLEVFEGIVPRCEREGQYLHPGPEHIEYVTTSLGEEPTWSLNTDAHLRSLFMGRSESIPIIDGKLELGEFGQVYFVDFDGVRERTRVVRVQVVGDRRG
jgi:secondary thiamine-phosphate synthase enzyme